MTLAVTGAADPADASVWHIAIKNPVSDEPTSARAFIQMFAIDGGTRTAFVAALAACPFAAYFFECAPLSVATLGAPLRIVLVNAPQLAASPEDAARPQAFAHSLEHARTRDKTTATFENLSGDATLVVPVPPEAEAEDACYAHLAAFVRHAPADMVKQTVRDAVEALQAGLGNGRTVWFSTSGLGVRYLHFRIASAPKYYSHAPFTAAPVVARKPAKRSLAPALAAIAAAKPGRKRAHK